MSTKVLLVKELADRNSDGKYDKLIERAGRGDYHDYESHHATPKMKLVDDLRSFPELSDIVENVKKGVYDE